jgi:glycosyltransferase involved in cell wall biosynthesis
VLDPFLESKPFFLMNQGNQKIRLLNIGELHPKKDQRTLLESLELLISDGYDIDLTIVGDGIEEKNLKDLAQYLKINDRVIFTGRQSREEVYQHLIESNIYVLCSKYETFGVAVIEAMLFGKPVIVTRCGGPESFVFSNSGYVINAENKFELKEAIISAISNLHQFNSENIREETIRNFGKDAFVKRINNVYEQISSRS